jgi:hypothetical protein
MSYWLQWLAVSVVFALLFGAWVYFDSCDTEKKKMLVCDWRTCNIKTIEVCR